MCEFLLLHLDEKKVVLKQRELAARIRQLDSREWCRHLKMSGASYRIDEPYVKVGTSWKYLSRAVDSAGNTIEFMQERQT